jgi:hypothetical protein
MHVCGWSSREMIDLYSSARADELSEAEFRRLMSASVGSPASP